MSYSAEPEYFGEMDWDCEWMQSTIKYILKSRNNQLTSDRICGILFQYNECSEKTHIDFTIQLGSQNTTEAKITTELNPMSKVNRKHQKCMETIKITPFTGNINLIDPFDFDSNSYCLIDEKLTKNDEQPDLRQEPLVIGHLSDFHYDRYYAPGSSSNCVDFICCRNTSRVSLYNFRPWNLKSD